MASKPKPGRPNTRGITPMMSSRISKAVYERVVKLAAEERRTTSAQFEQLVDEALQARAVRSVSDGKAR